MANKSSEEKDMRHERIFLNPNDDRVFIDTYVKNLGKDLPAMLVIPGGGYSAVCTEREGEPVALEFVSQGYNAFVLNYRVGKAGDVFPKQLLDAASAMVYIREHAEEFSIDPKRVFAVGFSAGGHLCGTLATMFDYPEVKEAFGDKYKLVRPTGAILCYPVTTLTSETHMNSFKNLLGRPSGEFTEEEVNRYSLDRVVKGDSSPMFVWHTAEDALVPVQGSLTLGLALTRASVPYRLTVYPYGPHGIVLSTEVTKCGNEAYIQPLAVGWPSDAVAWMSTLADSEL